MRSLLKVIGDIAIVFVGNLLDRKFRNVFTVSAAGLSSWRLVTQTAALSVRSRLKAWVYLEGGMKPPTSYPSNSQSSFLSQVVAGTIPMYILQNLESALKDGAMTGVVRKLEGCVWETGESSNSEDEFINNLGDLGGNVLAKDEVSNGRLYGGGHAKS